MLLWLAVIASAGWTEPADPAAGVPFNEGVAALDAADPATAEARFRDALALDPSWGRATLGVAMSLTRQDRPADALALLEPLAEVYADEPLLWVNLSEARFSARDWPGAEAAARTALGLAPADVSGMHALVDVLLRTGETMQAEAALDAVAKAHPDPAWSCLRVRVAAESKALDRLDALVAGCADADPALVADAQSAAAVARGEPVGGSTGAVRVMIERANQAMRLLQQGDTAEATAIADRLVAAHPRDTRVRILRGRIAYFTGDLDAAIAHYRRAFDDDDWVEVHRDGVRTGILTRSQERDWEVMVAGAAATLASVYAERGELTAAGHLVDQARARFGDLPGVHVAAAWVAIASDRPGEAWDALAAALADPQPGVVDTLASDLLYKHAHALPAPMVDLIAGVEGHPEVLLNTAAGLVNAGRGAQALPVIGPVWDQVTDRALAVGIGYSSAVLADDPDAAERWRLRAVAARAVDPVSVRNHAVILSDAGRHAEVLRLLAAHPAMPDAATFRVLAMTALEDTAGLSRAALADGVDVTAQYNAGAVLANAGDAAAVPVLEAACARMAGSDRTDCEAVVAELRGG